MTNSHPSTHPPTPVARALMKSPLLIGHDLLNLNKTSLALLKKKVRPWWWCGARKRQGLLYSCGGCCGRPTSCPDACLQLRVV